MCPDSITFVQSILGVLTFEQNEQLMEKLATKQNVMNASLQ